MDNFFVLDPRVGFDRQNPIPWADPYLASELGEKSIEINGGQEAFTNEMKAQGSWDDVTVQ